MGDRQRYYDKNNVERYKDTNETTNAGESLRDKAFSLFSGRAAPSKAEPKQDDSIAGMVNRAGSAANKKKQMVKDLKDYGGG